MHVCLPQELTWVKNRDDGSNSAGHCVHMVLQRYLNGWFYCLMMSEIVNRSRCRVAGWKSASRKIYEYRTMVGRVGRVGSVGWAGRVVDSI